MTGLMPVDAARMAIVALVSALVMLLLNILSTGDGGKRATYILMWVSLIVGILCGISWAVA